MTPPTTTATDLYLKKVRQGLASLPAVEREDIIAELRFHLFERQGQGSADPLTGFDSDEQLAAEFLTAYALRGALAQSTSWALGKALSVAGRDSVLGLLVLFPLLILQLSAGALLLAAAFKPFLPDNVGLWMGEGRFYAGIVGHPAGALGVVGGIFVWLSLRQKQEQPCPCGFKPKKKTRNLTLHFAENGDEHRRSLPDF